MRALSAKIWASASTGLSFSASFSGMDGEEEAADAKGFAAGLLFVENGFEAAEPGDEKGLAFWLLLEGCTPKSDSPMLDCLGLVSSAGGGVDALS
jgi:hypothetical protein